MAEDEQQRAESVMRQAFANVAALSFNCNIPTTASVAYTLSAALDRIAGLSLGVRYRYYETAVKRNVLVKLRRRAQGGSRRPTLSDIDRLLTDELLATGDDAWQDAMPPLRIQLLEQLCKEGPIPRECLMLAWVMSERLPGHTRDIVANAVRPLQLAAVRWQRSEYFVL
eukprot:5771080-Pleurochrysis_carterae.AAC.1